MSPTLLVLGGDATTCPLPIARYNAATRGRLAFPCPLSRGPQSLRSWPSRPGIFRCTFFENLIPFAKGTYSTYTRMYVRYTRKHVISEALVPGSKARLVRLFHKSWSARTAGLQCICWHYSPAATRSQQTFGRDRTSLALRSLRIMGVVVPKKVP